MPFIHCTGTVDVNVDDTFYPDGPGYPYCVNGVWEELTIEDIAARLDPTATVQLLELLNSVFMTPSTVDISKSFMAGISIPLLCYLVAYGYGVVVNSFNK